MFEVGKAYRVKMWDMGDYGGGATEYHAGEVTEVALPLVKFKKSASTGGGELVINTASLAFISAWESVTS